MQIKDTLRNLREKRGLTQEAVARGAGVSLRIVSFWEAGRVEPSMRLLHKVADFYGVSISRLLR